MDRQEIKKRIEEAMGNLQWILDHLDDAYDSQILESIEESGEWEYSIIKELRGY